MAAPSHITAMDTIDRENISSKPVAKPRGKAKVLRAKPAKGEVNHAALTDKIISRFPNILKVLAE
ncbi:MAG: hypothetical protein WB697_15630 [Stellaceae bacterium]